MDNRPTASRGMARNSSTFPLGGRIEFKENGHIKGHRFADYVARLCQALSKVALFVLGGPRPAIRIMRALNKQWDACWFYFPEQRSGSCVALTFDDAPGKDKSLCHKVLDLLEVHNAKATFFITSNYVNMNEKNRQDALRIHQCGHELGNHMPEDKPYHTLDTQDFSFHLNETEECLRKLRMTTEAPTKSKLDEKKLSPSPFIRWFRPPFAKLSKSMLRVLESAHYKVALGDVFANDVLFQDVKYLKSVVHKHIRPGSIIVLHCPDVGFREKNLEETKAVLEVLKEKGLESVTLSTLYNKCLDLHL